MPAIVAQRARKLEVVNTAAESAAEDVRTASV
jgi:hypothetical protein